MKIKLYYIIFLFFSVISVNAQIIVTDPEFPIPSGNVTITFDASLCECPLIGYTGDLYAHTGVTIEGQGQWQYVIGDWGNNSNQPQLERIGTDLYELVIDSINGFYDVPVGQVVTEMCFVFRSADGTQQSGDIFVDVFSDNDVTIVSPDSTTIYSPGLVNMNAIALFANEITLFVNDIEITTQTGTEFDYDYSTSGPGIYTVKFSATDGSTTIEKETFFFLRADNVIEDLPSGLIDGINYINDNSVTLVLYAPFKDFAFVKGSFDDWQIALSNQMKQTPDGDRYWITLEGLTAGEEYIYQYIVDGNIVIADPYADKLSDPWNDQYISNTTYPNLIEYPGDKTSGIASVFQTAQTPYSWVVDNFTRPDNEDLVIYELLVRDFVEAHDYQTLIDTINYFKELGINAIELMPVNEFEGNISWGYNPSFFFAPDKYYGTKNKLKEFIDVCHQNDIAVIMDIVLNHSYGLCPLVQLYFDSSTGNPATNNPWFNVVSPNPVFAWGYDFDHESPDTKNFVSRVVKYWLNDYKFDGFRFDFTKGFTNTPGDGGAYDAARINILKDIADTVWSNTPGAYVILEHFADNSEEIVLSDYNMMIWGNITYSYQQASMGYSGWDFSWASYQERGWNNPNLVSYMESHDEERMMYKNLNFGNSSGSYNIQDEATALKRSELAGAFYFTIPGPKMIWQFEELGYDYSINHCQDGTQNDACRVDPKPIRWDYFDDYNRGVLFGFFRAFIDLKKSYEAFSTEDYDLYLSGNLKQINLFHPTMDVVIYGNFDVEENSGQPNLSSSAVWYDYYTQEEYNNSTSFNLAPGEYKILTSIKLDLPDIPEIQYAPVADNVMIAGDLFVGKTLHGTYQYTDENNDPEGESIYQWFRVDDTGGGRTAIPDANDTTYVLTSNELDKYIMFQVTPVADSNSNPEGVSATSENYGLVSILNSELFVYPSPAEDFITIEDLESYEYVKIFNNLGLEILEFKPENNNSIDVSYLRPGLYFVQSEKGGIIEVVKFVKM